MNTDDLRTLYGKPVHFNCQSGDEAFTDDYVLWLEKHLMEQSEGEQLGSEMEPYNTGEDFALVSSLRRMHELKAKIKHSWCYAN